MVVSGCVMQSLWFTLFFTAAVTTAAVVVVVVVVVVVFRVNFVFMRRFLIFPGKKSMSGVPGPEYTKSSSAYILGTIFDSNVTLEDLGATILPFSLKVSLN